MRPMRPSRRAVPTLPYVIHPADRAMGLELEANELEDELQWAEAQGRADDAQTLRARLMDVMAEWSRAADEAAQYRAAS